MRSLFFLRSTYLVVLTCIAMFSSSPVTAQSKMDLKGFKESDFSKALSPVGRILEMEGWHVWCASPIWGDDGKLHVFFSRWRGGHNDWLKESEIAHAVADHPEGPYKVVGTVLKGRGNDYWDANTIHNPTVHKVGDKYVLFYIGNNLEYSNRRNEHHASSQRIGMLVSDSLYGPWKMVDDHRPVLDINQDKRAWDSYLVTNPAFLHHPNGEYWLYYKAWDRNNDDLRKVGVAKAKSLKGPYLPSAENPLVSFAKHNKQSEDPYVFLHGNKFYMILRDMGLIHPNIGLILESTDGINWSEPMLGYHTSAHYFGGKVHRFERPQILMTNGKPTHLFLSLAGGKYNTSTAAVLKIDETLF